MSNNRINNGIDTFWDNWLDGVKRFNELQTTFEDESYKAFNHFDQLLKPMTEVLNSTEKESRQLIKETNERLQENLQALPKERASLSQLQLLKKIEDINNETQHLFWASNQALFENVSLMQENIVKNMESMVNEQQQSRKSMVEKLSQLIDEVKSTQKSTFTIK